MAATIGIRAAKVTAGEQVWPDVGVVVRKNVLTLRDRQSGEVVLSADKVSAVTRRGAVYSITAGEIVYEAVRSRDCGCGGRPRLR